MDDGFEYFVKEFGKHLTRETLALPDERLEHVMHILYDVFTQPELQ